MCLATQRKHSSRKPAFEQLRGWLDEVEAFWADQLASFKVHAERKQRGKRGAKRG